MAVTLNIKRRASSGTEALDAQPGELAFNENTSDKRCTTGTEMMDPVTRQVLSRLVVNLFQTLTGK